MRKPLSYFSAITFILLGAPALASAFEIIPFGGFQVSDLADPPNSTGGIGGVVGLGLTQAIASDLSIEVDYLYMIRSTNQEVPPAATTTYYYQEVPVLVRVNPPGSIFSFGAGIYYAHGVGNITTQFPGAVPTYSSYSDNQLSRTDYGALAAIGIRLPVTKVISVYGDGRAQLGVKNINQAGGSGEEWRDYFQFLGGITIKVGS